MMKSTLLFVLFVAVACTWCASAKKKRTKANKLTRPQIIPRTVFHTFEPESVAQLPPLMAKHVEHWHELNPEYEFRYFGGEARREYMIANDHHFPGVALAYSQALNGAAEVDLWGALALWVEGGVYMDIDLVAVQPLHTAIKPTDEACSTVSHNPSVKFMVYKARHPFLKALLETALSRYQSGERRNQYTCGPGVHGEVAAKVYNLPDGRQLNPAGVYTTKDGSATIRAVASKNGRAFGGVWLATSGEYRQELREFGLKHWTIMEREYLAEKKRKSEL